MGHGNHYYNHHSAGSFLVLASLKSRHSCFNSLSVITSQPPTDEETPFSVTAFRKAYSERSHYNFGHHRQRHHLFDFLLCSQHTLQESPLVAASKHQTTTATTVVSARYCCFYRRLSCRVASLSFLSLIFPLSHHLGANLDTTSRGPFFARQLNSHKHPIKQTIDPWFNQVRLVMVLMLPCFAETTERRARASVRLSTPLSRCPKKDAISCDFAIQHHIRQASQLIAC